MISHNYVAKAQRQNFTPNKNFAFKLKKRGQG